MSKVIIIGGGAAGMFAAVHASDKGHEVHLFEKNEKLGKKLYITGKGRCNITNACDVEELFQAVIGNPKFLYSSFYTYTNQNVIDFFENEGLATKIERGNRVFPVSDHSSDVIRTLSEAMRKRGVQVHLNQKVEKVLQKDGTFDVLPKKEVIGLKKEMQILNTNLGGIKEMDKLPSLIFLADSKKEYICTKEARKLEIPTIGLIDSNCNPEDVDYVIAGNDDAVKSVSLIASKIADAIIEAKEGNMTEATEDNSLTMDELVKEVGVDKIERKPRQNNRPRQNNYTKREKTEVVESKEAKTEE